MSDLSKHSYLHIYSDVQNEQRILFFRKDDKKDDKKKEERRKDKEEEKEGQVLISFRERQFKNRDISSKISILTK